MLRVRIKGVRTVRAERNQQSSKILSKCHRQDLQTAHLRQELGKLDEQWHHYPWVLGSKVLNFCTVLFLGLAPQDNTGQCTCREKIIMELLLISEKEQYSAMVKSMDLEPNCPIPACQFPSCTTLGISLNLSVPQFPHLEIEKIIVPTSHNYLED